MLILDTLLPYGRIVSDRDFTGFTWSPRTAKNCSRAISCCCSPLGVADMTTVSTANTMQLTSTSPCLSTWNHSFMRHVTSVLPVEDPTNFCIVFRHSSFSSFLPRTKNCNLCKVLLSAIHIPVAWLLPSLPRHLVRVKNLFCDKFCVAFERVLELAQLGCLHSAKLFPGILHSFAEVFASARSVSAFPHQGSVRFFSIQWEGTSFQWH